MVNQFWSMINIGGAYLDGGLDALEAVRGYGVGGRPLDKLEIT